MLVGINADERLKHGRTHLVGERDHADLREAEMKFTLEQGIYRHDERLHHVVEKVREAECAQDIEARLRRLRDGPRAGDKALFHMTVPY